MRSIKFNLSKKPSASWEAAVLLVESYLSSHLKADQLLEQLPETLTGQARAGSQSLFLGALRHGHLSRCAYQPLLQKKPRERVEAVLLVAGFELTQEPTERHPKVVHHAVESAKTLVEPGELRFLNAVLRQIPGRLETIRASADLAARYSHPDWLVGHWVAIFGAAATEGLLRWNQDIPPLYLKCAELPKPSPAGLSPTPWPDFYGVDTKTDWKANVLPLIETGKAYFKDPSTRHAPELLAGQPGEQVLDLCAAPGGKAFDIAQQLQGSGRIVCVDRAGPRIARLGENLDRIRATGVETAIVEADLTELSKDDFLSQNLPTAYDAVMLDAPCSNTGVIQRRTDVKWRLQPEDIAACTKLQQQLIHSAARFVRPGGRLVYSTCSIEPSENRELVEAFLASKSGAAFRLVDERIALPWVCGHDGASAFLLQRDDGLAPCRIAGHSEANG